jgi:hypothetical protein
LVEQRGIEPLTSALRTRRSAKLSYCPTRSVILGSVRIRVKERFVRSHEGASGPRNPSEPGKSTANPE